MSYFHRLLFLFFAACCLKQIRTSKQPTVLISINSRNDEHLLPTFLGYLDKLNYPKKRISLFIQTDHNEDNTFNVLSTWTSNVRHMYHRIQLKHEEEPIIYPDASGPNQFSEQRFMKLLQLRQNALQEARNQWADYLLFIDADNFLYEADTLQILMGENKTIIAPLLKTMQSRKEGNSMYTNFWGGVNENGYYKRVPLYRKIVVGEEIGTFEVPMIHSTILIDMRNQQTDLLRLYPVPSFYDSVFDDMFIFRYVVHAIAELKFYVCNKATFGYLLPSSENLKTMRERQILFTNAVLDLVADTLGEPIVRSEFVPRTFPKPTFGEFDEIFMINLKRRTERYEHMKNSLQELGLKWTHFEAVDGKNLSKQKLDEMGIKPMGDFKDAFFKRPITHGEVGCFLSHYYIWKEMVERKLDTVLILEDDVRFEADFRKKLKKMMDVANCLTTHPASEWDLLYVGRKILMKNEQMVEESDRLLVFPKFSFWTLGYVLRLSGAKKLLHGNPLKKMIPVDDYIPIKFGRHKDKALMKQFEPLDVVALAANPLLVNPTHYPNEEDYISDTEDTNAFDDQELNHREKVDKQKTSGSGADGKSTRTDL